MSLLTETQRAYNANARAQWQAVLDGRLPYELAVPLRLREQSTEQLTRDATLQAEQPFPHCNGCAERMLVLHHRGLVRAETADELIDAARALAYSPMKETQHGHS